MGWGVLVARGTNPVIRELELQPQLHLREGERGWRLSLITNGQ